MSELTVVCLHSNYTDEFQPIDADLTHAFID